MRIIILGGTKFIGRAITNDLLEHGHELLIVHRGETELETEHSCQHLHTDRNKLAEHKSILDRFRPDAVVDTIAMNECDAQIALSCLPSDIRFVVLSSMDVYRAFGAVLNDSETDALPIDENSPVRATFFPHKGTSQPGADKYEKLHVEAQYAKVHATILRLPMVYGPHDPRRREGYILSRVRARRKQIPIGPGNWLWSKGFVFDIAISVRLALETATARGEIINICESKTSSFLAWSKMILQAANSDAELVLVDERHLPEDIGSLMKTRNQHLLMSNEKERHLLKWAETDPQVALEKSVQWHLEHPPEGDPFFNASADDKALSTSRVLSK